MPKNKYPDSLGLDDCKNLDDVICKLEIFYGMENADFGDLIREILGHRYGLNKLDDKCDNDLQLLKHLMIDCVPGTPKDIIFNIDEYDRSVEFCNKINNRHASIIAMFKVLLQEGKSQNQIAQILVSQGMSKGMKVRYHEALRNPDVAYLSSVFEYQQMAANLGRLFSGKPEVRVDILIDIYNENKESSITK